MLIGVFAVFAFLTAPSPTPPTPITRLSALKANPDEYHEKTVRVRTDGLAKINPRTLGYLTFHDRPPVIIVVFAVAVDPIPEIVSGRFRKGEPHTITVDE